MLFLSKEKSLGWIILLGAVLRVLFVFVGGPVYYGNADYFIQGDTSSWFRAFINLYDTGTFTINPAIEAGKFFRPPGYSFLFGVFYLLSFKNYVVAWKLLVGVQVIMDIACIYLISRIAKSVVRDSPHEGKTTFLNCAALLYAIYPFVIIWAPVLYAESSSVFFLLLCVYYAFQKSGARNAFLSGLFGGIAALIRLQCAFGVLFIGVMFLFSGNANNKLRQLRYIFIFCFAILVTYGLWPARNYFLQDRILFSQDLRIGRHWSPDFMSFLDFTHSISTDHTAYYFQILKNENVTWPPAAYIDIGDSALLDSAVGLCRTCGTGFAYWKWGEHITQKLELNPSPCDSAIANIFTALTKKQKEKNAFHYWVVIPLENLKKCFFKFSIYGNKSLPVKLISSLLFIFRSMLILLGLFGIYLAFKNHFLKNKFLLFALLYMIAWYLDLSIFYRNMEMRYLLHTDILLLIPAAYVLTAFLSNKYPQAT